MNRLLAILWSSAIAAAFLGPGTITTAARAGAGHGLTLLWALAFSVIACLVLQEASGRLTVVSGKPLGVALRERMDGSAWAVPVLIITAGAVLIGCAAYEAGNVLGGVAGAGLLIPNAATLLTLVSVGAAGLLLWLGSTGVVVTVLGTLVAAMGAAFVIAAVALGPDLGALARGLAVPTLPSGSALLVLGLVGTTVVPYNLFLGSGLARGQSLGEMRLGLTIAIGLGGLISMAVVVVGTAIDGPFGFAALAGVLADRLGAPARTGFAVGLFAAGFSSAVTAPLAAAMTARSLFETPANEHAWGEKGWRYRAVWLGVLGTGLLFGLTGIRPIPAIIAAQALNGLMLPLVAAFLVIAINDRRLLGAHVNRLGVNVLTFLVLGIATLLGTVSVLRAGYATLGRPPAEGVLFGVGIIVALAIVFWVGRIALRARAA